MYATKKDMISRYGELECIQISDRNRTGVIDTEVLNTALSDAAVEIDGFLSRYSLPFKTTPPELVRVACDIAHYRLLGINNTLLTDEIIKRYDRNVAWLDKVAKGSVNLSGVVNDNDGINDDGDAVQFEKSTRIFTR